MYDAWSSDAGLMYFPVWEKALSELHRVLKPDGKLVLAVWGTADQTDFPTMLSDLCKGNVTS